MNGPAPTRPPMSAPLSISRFVRELDARLRAAGLDAPGRTAEELTARALDCRPLETRLREDVLPEAARETIEPLARRVEAGEPLRYVLGETEFMGRTFRCDRRALVPRPETELLVERALACGAIDAPRARVADVGTGSGCIAASLALARPEAIVFAIDRSVEALELARENAYLHGAEERIRWRNASLLDGFEARSLELVVSNPPYVPSAVCDGLAPSVRDHEPRLALDGGSDGLDLVRRLAEQAFDALVPGGRLLIEIGYDQGAAARDLLAARGFSGVRILPDLAGHDRIAEACRE